MIKIHMYRKLALLLIVATIANGCSELTSDGYDYGYAEVEIMNTKGEPISGVELLLYSGSRHMEYATTKQDGQYRFRLAPFLNYGVRILSARGYELNEGRGQTYMDGIRADQGAVDSITFVLSRNEGTIHVTVLDDAGAPIEGTDLALYDFQRTLMRGQTDDDGVYTFRFIPPGDYGVHADPPPGYIVEEARGKSFFDGIVIGEVTETSVTFTFSRE